MFLPINDKWIAEVKDIARDVPSPLPLDKTYLEAFTSECQRGYDKAKAKLAHDRVGRQASKDTSGLIDAESKRPDESEVEAPAAVGSGDDKPAQGKHHDKNAKKRAKAKVAKRASSAEPPSATRQTSEVDVDGKKEEERPKKGPLPRQPAQGKVKGEQ